MAHCCAVDTEEIAVRKSLLVPLAIAAVLLAGCSSGDHAADATPTSAVPIAQETPVEAPVIDVDPEKYRQTWPNQYEDTSCATYGNGMTAKERWVAAADMLTAARSDSGSNEALPEDSMVDEFESGIDEVCAANPDLTLALAAAGLYESDTGFQP